MEFASVRLAGASPLHTSFLYLEPELLGNTAASTVGTSLLNLLHSLTYTERGSAFKRLLEPIIGQEYS